MKQLKNFPYHHALVLGLAKSGFAAAELLQYSGVTTVVNDLKTDEDSEQARKLKESGVSLVTGSHPEELLDKAEVVVKNPGIPYENEMISEAVRRGIPVITEVELVSYLHEGKIIGITGSNGKTTTTTLVHRMLEEDGKRVHLAGNIGEVACEVARYTEPEDIMVIELSSFQLLGVSNLHIDVAVWLNLFDSHLDYHKTRDNYVAAKAKILENQAPGDTFIYNGDDAIVESFQHETSADSVPFTLGKDTTGAYADETFIYFKDEIIAEREKIVLVGEHNIQNCLAAIAACKSAGVTNSAIQSVLYSFKGVDHRLQYVEKKQGRYFYNDSKATNIRATSHALGSFKKPVVLLAGGLDRGNSFDDLIPYLSGVKHLVLFGETAAKLEEVAKECDISYVRVETMEEAVYKAYEASGNEEVILLSPACASWDQYRTFEERGERFIQAVHQL